LEKKIYDRQVNKQGMANRVVDEQNVESNFTWRELHALLDDLHEIKEPPIREFSEEELSQYRDDLIKHICTKLNNSITRTPFEHESLLLDRKETKLTNFEKKDAEHQYKLAKQLKQAENSGNFQSNYTSIRSQLNSRQYLNQMNSSYYMGSPSVLPSQITPTPNNFYDMPPYSQPLPPYTRVPPQTTTNFTNFESVAEALVRTGNTVKKVVVPRDLNISISPSNNIIIRKGEEVMVIRTQKGLYLRTAEGNIISIKNSNTDGFDPNVSSGSLPSFIPISNNDSFGVSFTIF
jgi:RAD54-like protein 2